MIRLMAVATVVILTVAIVSPVLGEALDTSTARSAASSQSQDRTFENRAWLIGAALAGLVVLALGPAESQPIQER